MNEVAVVSAPMLALILLIFILALVTFNSIYDVFSRFYETKASRLRPFKLPYITVIITIDADIQTVRDCISSLRSSSYKKYDVVVANNHQSLGGSDTLSKIIIGLSVPGYYYKSRKRHTYDRLVKEAYKRSKRGDITVLVDSRVRFTDSTLQCVAERQSALAAGKVLRVDASDPRHGFIGVVSSLTNSLRSLLMLSGYRLVVRRPRSLRPRTIFSSRYSTRFDSAMKQVYEPGIVFHGEKYRDESKASARRILWAVIHTFLALLFAYISIVMVIYAMDSGGIEGFMVTWVALTFTGLSLILFDTRMNLHHKIEAIFCVGFMPILIALAFLASVVREARAIKAQLN